MADKTAWGEIVVSTGTPGVSDAMSAALTEIGTILEDSISISKEDGTLYSLKGTGGKLIDEMKGEPTFKVLFTLVGIENATEFWKMDATKTTAVKSFVNSTKFSVKFASKVAGSRTFEAPYCAISGTPEFSEKQGWTVPMEVTVLMGGAGYLFDFGTVAG